MLSTFFRNATAPRLAAVFIFLPLLLNLIVLMPSAKAVTRDGFFAYCTSNLDGTGECVNEEDELTISCLIVPGQIISCPTSTQRTMECVWISSITANQAQFWCDPEDEALLYGAGIDSTRTGSFQDVLPGKFQ
jgi:hypothetical protein